MQIRMTLQKGKTEQKINEWLSNPGRALLVTGARQVGKTFSIRRCLSERQCDHLELNLIEHPEQAAALEQSYSVDDLKINLSALTGYHFADGKTSVATVGK